MVAPALVRGPVDARPLKPVNAAPAFRVLLLELAKVSVPEPLRVPFKVILPGIEGLAPKGKEQSLFIVTKTAAG